MKEKFDEKILTGFIYFLLCCVLIIILYPLYFTVIASLSDPFLVARGGISFYIKGFNLDAYSNVFKNSIIYTGFRNSIFYTTAGTFLNLLVTIPAAYALSKNKLVGRRMILLVFVFTMYFGGGLVPTYLLVRNLNLVNTPWVLVLIDTVNVYYLLISRSYYQTSIPEEIYEAAKIDGANDIGIFVRITLPLSTTIIAVIALFYGVLHWNGFFSALIYITNKKLYPIQLVLRDILIMNVQMYDFNTMTDSELQLYSKMAFIAEQIKYSVIFIASFPMLVAYPFVQKYFLKGVMIGSIKA